MPLVQILSYLSIICFLVFTISRIIKIASSPVHLRWELYPVPHERGKAHYGGSRMEDSNWWEKKQHPDHINEIKTMASEIVLLKGVWEKNKSLWFGSFPFHFAMYIIIVNIVISIICAFFLIIGISPVSPVYTIYHYLFTYLAYIGASIGLIGSLRLLFSRISDRDLRKFSNASHYFNILLIASIFGSFLLWSIETNVLSIHVLSFFKSLITFQPIAEISPVGTVHLFLFMFFIIYMPFTHMTHMFTKYFTYHKVRWEDNAMNPKMKNRLIEQLNYKVTWAAPHIAADGNKTWLAIATETKEEDMK